MSQPGIGVVAFHTRANFVVLAWNEGATVFGGGRVEHGLSRVSVELIDVGNVA